MSALVEVRRYTLHPGRRDELIALFERELVAPQEAVGLRVLGWYRDRDEPDHFVWLRGFDTDDADARGRALTAFYTGEAWAAHADAANATMIDSDDVHLLRPRAPFTLPPGPLRLTIGAEAVAGALILDTAAIPNTFPRLPVHADQVVVSIAQDDGTAVPGSAFLDPVPVAQP